MTHLPLSYQCFFLLLIGAAFGSFGNVLIYRLPRGEPLDGRSHCPRCNHTLGVLDLFPLLSFFCLRAKCRYCKAPISWQYPLVELVSALLFFSTSFLPNVTFVEMLLAGFSLWILLLIAVIDAQTQGIPDLLNIPLLVFTGLYSVSTGTFDMFALAIGVGFLGLQWMVSFGNWVGSGDVILIASMALLVGPWQHMLILIMLSYMLGALIASFLLATGKKKRRDHLAFAPFLVLAAMIVFFWGPKLVEGFLTGR